jgi:hypothetical protein
MRLVRIPGRQQRAKERLTELRTVRVAGPGVRNLTEEVLLLAGTDGRVEKMVNLSRKDERAFAEQLPKLASFRLEWPRPDELPHKAVRRGLFTCSTATGCAVVLDLPGMQSLSGAFDPSPVQVAKSHDVIRIVKLEPPEGSELRAGRTVVVVATVAYEVAAEEAIAAMLIQDQARRPLTDRSLYKTVKRGKGEVTLRGTIKVPADATHLGVLLALGAPDQGPAPRALVAVSYVVR